MKHLKMFNEYADHVSFLSAGIGDASGKSITGNGISPNSAGSGGKDQRESGPESWGPDGKKYDQIVKSMKGEKVRKRKRKKKISRNNSTE
jgi:hypothetical protein